MELPPGRKAGPLAWITDDPPPPGLWGSLRAGHDSTGLWPLVLGESKYSPGDPWTTGELDPSLITSRPADHDADELLAGWWSSHTAADGDDDMLTPAERRAVTAPFEDRWPGPAPAGSLQEDPDVRAAEFADHLVADNALHVAAEHFAFCPDNVWQSGTTTLVSYAGSITGRAWWSFWWD